MRHLVDYNINKHLVDFITENSNPILLGSKTLIKLYVSLFGTEYYNLCGNKSLKGDTKHVHELFRGYLGKLDDIDTVLSNVQIFLNALDIKDNEYQLEYIENEPEASGSYPCVKITFNNNINKDLNKEIDGENIKIKLNCPNDFYLYVVNTSGKVKRKELTPASLGITEHNFKTSNELFQALEKSEKIKLNPYNNIFLDLLKRINNETKKQHETLNDLIETPYTFTDINIGEIDERSLKTILNDFGEIIGGSYLLNSLVGDHKLFYPGKSNYRNVDYFIDYDDINTESNENALAISAKSNKGAACSCTAMANKILSIKSALELDKNSKLKDFVDNIIPALATNEKGQNNSSIIVCQNMLLNYISKNDNSNDKIFEKTENLLKSNNIIYIDNSTKLFDFNLDEIMNLYKKDKEKLYDIIDELYNILNYKPSSEFSLKNKENCNLFNNFLKYKHLPLGCIAYPIKSKLIEYINIKYSNEISECCKLGSGYYQIYLKYDNFKQNIQNGNTCSLTFILQKTDLVNKWKLEASGSVSNPKIKAISCRPIC